MNSWDLLKNTGETIGLKQRIILMVDHRMTLSRTVKSSRMRGSGDQDRIESENVRFVGLNDRYAEWVYGQGQKEPKAKEDEGPIVQ
jgi:hypothetical protein